VWLHMLIKLLLLPYFRYTYTPNTRCEAYKMCGRQCNFKIAYFAFIRWDLLFLTVWDKADSRQFKCVSRTLPIRYLQLMARAVHLSSVICLWRYCALRRNLNLLAIFVHHLGQYVLEFWTDSWKSCKLTTRVYEKLALFDQYLTLFQKCYKIRR